MRKLASIVEVESSVPHPNADRLSIVTMNGNGWKVITGRDEFHEGDLAVYFEIDSYLPADDERYAFLRDRCLRKFVSKSGNVLREGIRIKTCKLRGEISQGLLMPLDKFIEITDNICGVEAEGEEMFNGNGETEHLVGADVTRILKVEHYDEIKAALAPQMSKSIPCDAKMSDFPTDFMPKTDEERIQNLTCYFTTMKGRKFEVTAKDDGSSVVMFYSPMIDSENPFGVCSRNMRLKPVTDKGVVPLPWQMAKKYEAEVKIRAANGSCGSELAFQGELVGPGVNGNADRYTDFEWHIFKVFDIKKQEYLLPSDARFICNAIGFTYVQVVEEEFPVFDRMANLDELLKFAEGKTLRGNEREGLVFKTVDRPYRTFKVISNRYLLKQED